MKSEDLFDPGFIQDANIILCTSRSPQCVLNFTDALPFPPLQILLHTALV